MTARRSPVKKSDSALKHSRSWPADRSSGSRLSPACVVQSVLRTLPRANHAPLSAASQAPKIATGLFLLVSTIRPPSRGGGTWQDFQPQPA